MRLPSLAILFVLFGMVNCQKPSEPEKPEYSVPAEVEPYVQAFRQEAKLRNQTVSTDNLIVTFGTTQNEDVCGQCVLGKTPHISLNNDDLCWQKAYSQERECLIFHELGHCLLNRSHKTNKFPKGIYTSLMNPDNVTVYATCRYPIGDDDCDKRPRRTYYIDELFDPSTPAPAWAK